MCTFISLTINADADPAETTIVFERLGFRFEDAPSPKGLPAGRRYLAHAPAHCDCGTVIGSGRSDRAAYDDADLAKLRQNGWSEAKIERWARQKRDAKANKVRTTQSRRRAAHRDLASWKGMIEAALGAPTVKIVGIMHDVYAQGPGYDDLPLTVEPLRPRKSLDEATLFHLPQGTLVEWSRKG